MTSFLADARLALRLWRTSPTFSAIAILSIALGIGANSAIFTLVDQVLLRPLAVHDPDELVQVTFTGSRYGSNWGDGTDISYPMFTDLRDHNSVFSGMFARFGCALQVGHTGRTERVIGELVTGEYFSILGIQPALGRLFSPEQDKSPGGQPYAVLSHAMWTTKFNADPRVVDTSMIVNGQPFTIIGVAQRGFEGIELGRPTQVWVPLVMKAQLTPGWNGLDDRRWSWVRAFARMKRGVTREQAQVALQPFFHSLLEQEVSGPGFARAAATTRARYLKNQIAILDASKGRSGFRRSMTTPLWVLMATAAGVLLIACANIANLLLARGAARQREMAVRLALGATRGRLVRQLLVESIMLALAGGLGGVALGAIAAPMVLSFFANPDVPQPISTSPDWRILLFTFGVATLTGVLFGIAPAVQGTRPDVAPTLKDESGSVVSSRGRVRKALVTVQVAISLLLLIGAGLFVRTLDNLLKVDVGFRPQSLISFTVDPSMNGYAGDRTKVFVNTLLERLRTTPGVAAVGTATIRLLEGNQWNTMFTVEGYQPKGDEGPVWCNSITPGYFAAMGLPILMGRDFTERDARTGPIAPNAEHFRVAIVNESFARKYFGDGNPVGKRIGFGADPNTPTPIEIVGVVRDAKYQDVRDVTPRQAFVPFLESDATPGFTVYLRTTQAAEAMFGTIRQVVQQIDPNLPVFSTRTLERQVALSLRRERLTATMTTTFGALATLLAVVGLYGVMSYTVARRTREIGLRMALGAQAANIVWMIVREVLAIAAAGVVLAAPASWWLGRYIAAQLYGVVAMDPLSIGGAVLLLTSVAVIAGLVPSIRAARVDPTKALRTA
jgi:putative ABC transport system permease protein